jgi:S1-C subfamily serine protease
MPRILSACVLAVVVSITESIGPLSSAAAQATAGGTAGGSSQSAGRVAESRAPGALATVTVTVAIVGDNLTVKPVPLHELRFTPSVDSQGEPISARTALDGTVTVAVPVGRYVVTSTAPVTLDGMQYQWNVPVDAAAPGALRLELTNANAVTGAAVTTPVRTRQMAPEMEVYRQVRAGVFRIESGLAHGSGFLVDTTGLILTNAHVVAGQTTAAAVLDSATRVPLNIIYRDNDADVAVLQAAPNVVRGRPILPLAQTTPLVEAGERVFAIGYPLNQEQTVTSGIVSSVRQGAIISDVNINHGNSGGPMLNLAGEVVAINTFGDFTNQGGPGISGSVVIMRALAPLAEARTRAATQAPPSAALLPLLPAGRFRTQDLKAFADSVKPMRYAKFDSIGVGKFFVTLTTPPIAYVRQKAFEAAVGKDRKKREARAGMNEEERFSEMRDFRDWSEYVGDQRAPVVAITIEPKISETTGSVFRRLLLTGPGGKTTVRYAADLQAATVFRNGEPITLLKGGTTPVKAYLDNRWVDLKDVANYGYYILPAEAFLPNADGSPPSIVIDLADLKNPTFPSCRELPRDVTATVWNDFVLYYTAAGLPFVTADGTKRPVGVPDKDAVCKQARQNRGAPPAEAGSGSEVTGIPR